MSSPTPAPRWSELVAAFDTETTGVEVESSRIVTAALVVLDSEGDVVERRDWLIDPGVAIPDAAAAVHGITTDAARRDGMDAALGVSGIVGALREVAGRGVPLVAYNAAFDLTVLDREARRHGIDPLGEPRPVLDPLILDKELDRYRKGKRTLTAAAAHYDVDLVDAHDSGADAIAAGLVCQRIARRFAALLPANASDLHALQARWAQAQAERFEDYMRRTRDPQFRADGAWPLRSRTHAGASTGEDAEALAPAS